LDEDLHKDIPKFGSLSTKNSRRKLRNKFRTPPKPKRYQISKP